MKKLFGHLRATRRAATALAFTPGVIALALLQGAVIGPVFKNYTFAPALISRGIRRLFGIRVVFNAASAPLEKKKQVLTVANHISPFDAFVLSPPVKGNYVGVAYHFENPVMGFWLRAIKHIGVRRSPEFTPQARGNIIENFNAGRNTTLFPEADASKGDKVYMFHAGLATPLFGMSGINAKGEEVTLKKEVLVQPVAIRVAKVGKEAIGPGDPRQDAYIMARNAKGLKSIWGRLMTKGVTMELTAFPALDPKDFADAKAIMNRAAAQVATVVNPGQTTFEKRNIPSRI